MSDVKLIKVTVDGKEVEVPLGATALQAAELAGAEIPRFCYHERLSIAGNCRMCLVEVEKAPKPVASCAFPVMDGMKIITDSPGVRNARRGVMEFLLINHPLDCPICDQGGECDLQDQAVAYGQDMSRYHEHKRSVTDKYFGPLIKPIMTRCIQCTRCVRFATEVAGVPELGAVGRGEALQITTYVEKALSTELSGNLIDICPVGALTSRPYAFVSRPWELAKTDSIDVLDATGTNIRVDSRGPDILRVLPRVHEDVNEEWMADRGRFSIDAVKKRRLDRPWVRQDGKLRPATWPEAFQAIATKLKGLPGDRIGAVVGGLSDAESIVALKDLMAALGSQNLDCREDGAALDASNRAFYLFNSSIAGIEQADALLVIGSNPRVEAPVINARIRKQVLNTHMPVAVIGAEVNLTYPVTHLGNGPDALRGVMDGAFGDVLRNAKRPMILLGRGALARPDGAAVLAAAWALAQSLNAVTAEWNGFNLLHTQGGQVAALDLGFLPGQEGKDLGAMLGGGVDALWLLGADELDPSLIAPGTFVIYQGHHGDRAAGRADVILPGSTYLEKDGTYASTEGRVQRGRRAVFAPGEAREDWRILRAASELLGHALPYDDLAAVRARLVAVNPSFARVDEVPAPAAISAKPAGDAAPLGSAPFTLAITNYWQADVFGRASEVMAECARAQAPTPAMAAE
ncbi:NADH-quinone oxidoreductase subunit NuoG [Roseomonas xinghualingensis]|uniref:NADH-quinone oxidoreductase subunit NuoG n=1 Tax=Roseomonas xinghualingensis TaxID=2986475 RepID=UPI0021F1249C|nr:NADH-quinone oxidoreductase subunit NuoG [Roseomonas sp. SXEYE001]MCV4206759.1 NADH-quinone oxidoreductase subunit NuoG [Roseomonas sp. SXEYE001]